MKNLIDIVKQKTYHDLTDLERSRMVEFYKTHSLKECAVKWEISEGDGLPQFLSRSNPKMSKGGARHKAVISEKTEFETLKEELASRLGKDGKALILKLLKLYNDEKTGRI